MRAIAISRSLHALRDGKTLGEPSALQSQSLRARLIYANTRVWNVKRKFSPGARILISLSIFPWMAVLGADKADALLVFNFAQQGSDVTLKGEGAITGLPSIKFSGDGTGPNVIDPSLAQLLLGNNQFTPYNFYSVTGPTSFGSGATKALALVSSTDTHLSLQGNNSQFGLGTGYVEGTPITYSGIFANTTLADLGLSSTTGLLAEYSIGSDTIKVYAGPVTVPAPAPWIGGTVAFGFSRRLRSRLRNCKVSNQG